MAYTVLARKYRSQTFDEVVGQEPISKTLKNAIETGRVAHAYLFTGTRGVGKTTLARILAKALNCLEAKEPTTTPCLRCSSCLAINTGEDIDVIEIDGASNNRVDEIRELRENAVYRPARARYKIYIIDEVHMLTTAAFNALLKTLEEPPEHVKFIFATTEPNKVIATIQSRCQRFDFDNISPKVIAEQLRTILRKENIRFEEDLILPVARMANGSMRDALSLLDRLISTGIEPLTTQLLEDFLGRPNAEKIHRLIEKISDNDAAGTLTAIEELVCTGLGEIQIVDAVIESLRDLLVLRSTGMDTDLLILPSDQKEKAAALAKRFDAAALIYNITALEKLRWTIKNSDTPRALLDATLLRFALCEHFMNVDELLSRIQGDSVSAFKKKPLMEDRPTVRPSKPAFPRQPDPATTEPETLPLLGRSEKLSGPGNLADRWPDLLEAIRTKLGNGTVALLSGTSLRELKGDILSIEFPTPSRIEMCQSNGRADQIAGVLSEELGHRIRVRFEAAVNLPSEAAEPPARLNTQKRCEILNDPGVRAVLGGLEATVTKIEENP